MHKYKYKAASYDVLDSKVVACIAQILPILTSAMPILTTGHLASKHSCAKGLFPQIQIQPAQLQILSKKNTNTDTNTNPAHPDHQRDAHFDHRVPTSKHSRVKGLFSQIFSNIIPAAAFLALSYETISMLPLYLTLLYSALAVLQIEPIIWSPFQLVPKSTGPPV